MHLNIYSDIEKRESKNAEYKKCIQHEPNTWWFKILHSTDTYKENIIELTKECIKKACKKWYKNWNGQILLRNSVYMYD